MHVTKAVGGSGLVFVLVKAYQRCYMYMYVEMREGRERERNNCILAIVKLSHSSHTCATEFWSLKHIV